MPFESSQHLQSVIIQGTVYVGGGDVGILGSPNNYTIMAYDTSSGKWAKLPPYRTSNFAMTLNSNQLVLVGGWEYADRVKVVGVWNPDARQWTHPYPDMPTSRRYCSAVAYREWLVVAGGVGNYNNSLTAIDVLNTETKQWSVGPPLPAGYEWSRMKSAVVGDMCYFMGGYIRGGSTTTVYSVSLPGLAYQLNSNVSDSQIWKKIPGLQVRYSSPLSISGSLLAVGGWDKDRRVASTLYLYQADTGEWVKVGDLPTPRFNCTCTALTNTELLVAGGREVATGNRLIRSVDIGLIDLS